MLNFEMNISRRRRRRFIVDDDDDEHMNKNENIHHDMVVSSSRCHNIDGDDLITEILLRLPPIAVYRFRRVCKQWYSLISNPVFLRIHSSPSSPFQILHNTSTTPPHEHDHQLLVLISPRAGGAGNINVPRVEFVPLTQFQEQEDEDEDYRKQPPPLLKRFLDLSTHSVVESPEEKEQVYKVHYDLIDSCNGLFLLHSFGTYYICNPITKHYFKLPHINPIPNVEEENLIHSRHASLVFDPSISLSYKVIRYILGGSRRHRRGIRNDLHCQIYVYSSSETGSWKLLSTRIPDPTIIEKFNFRSVLLNGVLYCSYWFTREDVSVCFDVEKECVWFLSLPPKPRSSVRYCLYFGKCDGRLRLIERFKARHQSQAAYFYNLPWCFDIMETEPRQQHDGTWTVKYRVKMRKIYDFFHKEYASVIHCYKTKDRRGNEEEVLLVRLNHRSIVSFSLTSKKFIKVIADPERTELSCLRDPFAYTPTLFPVS